MHEGFTFYSSKLRGFRDWEHRVRWKYLSRRHKPSLDFGENAKARRQDCLRHSGLLPEEMLLEIADKDSTTRSCEARTVRFCSVGYDAV